MTTPPPIVRPGQRLSASIMNQAFLIGRLVFSAYRDAEQQISSNTVGQSADALQWDNVSVDLLGGWSAAQPGRYRPTVSGWYKVTGTVSLQSASGGSPLLRGASWRLNGALPPAATTRPWVGGGGTTYLAFAAPDLPLACNGVGDYLELCPFQNSGSAVPTATGSTRPSIAIYYAGPA
ncbi:hypothetical protein FH609_011730 [Streptomyces sp. 3MP-14]|uniref:DNRLRE domain-containing protein n=1 Tax=Streptomyces mimosae TaxID=2586635 RepID=A0A5N6AFP5_9ACTN|nr:MULTISPECIES: hypothetical protein [Streptomyces]KAB8167065.1 hypothetical protein FH607_009180 [Streptomyces mimosae]KAB8177006.1 hypothetical protein FH609_011730 [Streptomyces sp. 3MP-14]